MSITTAIIERLTFVDEFQPNGNREAAATNLVAGYAPRVLAKFNLARQLPEDHLAIQEYAHVMEIPPAQIPVFVAPSTGPFPIVENVVIHEPSNSSILPILIPARAANVDVEQYDIVSSRQSLRKIAMSSDEYTIGVIRHGKTLFLRRYDCFPHRLGEPGFVFAGMCTPDYTLTAEYNHLIEGHIGEFRTLIIAVVDAVVADADVYVDFKCPGHATHLHLDDKWLQMFLGNTEKLVIGYRDSNQPPRLQRIETRSMANLIDAQAQETILQRLHRALIFLQSNVLEGRSYLLRRHRRNRSRNEMVTCLYEVTDTQDKRLLDFVPDWLLNRLRVSSA